MNKSLQDAIEKAKQDPNGLSDADLEFIYQQGRADAIDEFVDFAKTHNFEINKRYYNETIQGFIIFIAEQIKEQNE